MHGWWMRVMMALVGGCVWVELVAGDPCANLTATTTLEAGLACWRSVPISPADVNATMDYVRAIVEAYSFTDILRHTGPPWQQQLDLLGQLRELRQRAWNNSFDFHDAITALLQRAGDTHTVFFKPTCFDSLLYQGIGIQASMQSSRLVLRVQRLVLGSTDVTTPQLVPLIGGELLAIDGVRAVMALTRYADEQVSRGSDSASRFTYLVTQQAWSVRFSRGSSFPTQSNTTYLIKPPSPASAPPVNVTIAWRVQPLHILPLANLTRLCQKPAPTPQPSPSPSPVARRMQGPFDTVPPPHRLSPLRRLLPASRPACTRCAWSTWNQPATASSSQSTSVRGTGEQGTPLHGREMPSVGEDDGMAGVGSREGDDFQDLNSEELATLLRLATIRNVDLTTLPRGQNRPLATMGGASQLTQGGARSLESSTMSLVFDETRDYSMYLVYDSGLNALRLRIYDFDPPIMGTCGYGDPTLPEEERTRIFLTCFDHHVHTFVSTATTRVFNAWRTMGASFLAIDVTENVGGYVMLGQALLYGLISAFYNDPTLATPAYDLRTSPLYLSMLQHLAANASLPDIMGWSSFYLVDGGQPTAQIPQSNASWYSARRPLHGPPPHSTYSALFTLYNAAQLRNAVSAPAITLNANNLVLITDGLCGSTCSMFLKTLHTRGVARVLQIGGLPSGLRGDASSFAGGFVSQGSAVESHVRSLAGVSPWVPPPEYTALLTGLPTTATISFTLGGAYSPRDSTLYAEYDVRVSDLQVYVWGTTDQAHVDAAVRNALPAIISQQLILPDGTITTGMDLSQDNSKNRYLPTTIALATVLGVTVVGLIALFAALVWVMRNSTPQPTSTGAGCCSRSTPVGRTAVLTTQPPMLPANTDGPGGTAIAKVPSTAHV